MIDFLRALLADGNFMPHGHCYLWQKGLLILHIVSDTLITAAYFSIPFTLVYFVRKRRDLEFNWMVLCFATFIVACGATHLMEIWVIWHPTYWVSGGVKALTALASVPTAVLLVRLVPDALRLPSPALLRQANAELESEIAERRRAETEVRLLNEELERRVAERVAELEATNRALAAEVAERTRIAAALQEHQQLLAAISDNSPAVIYAKDLAGRYLFVNRRFTALFHRHSESVLGRTDHDIFDAPAANAFRDMDRRVAAGGGPLTEEEVAPHDDGPHRYVSVKAPLRDAAGRTFAVFGISTDITERLRAEDALRASLKEVEALKTALDEHAIVAITDPRGRITYVNDKFCAISKYARDELLGQDHRLINSGHHPKEFIRDLWTTIAHGRVWHGEIRNRAKDGTFYWVETTIVPFLDERGRPRQYVAIRADITERKHAEETVRELNAQLERRVAERTAQLEAANGELEAFSYSVSHDLRAPLRAIDGFSLAVLEDCGPRLPDDGRRYLQTIRGSAQRMGALIDDLLAFARLGRQGLSRRTFDTARLVRGAFAELGEPWPERRVEVRVGALPASDGDPALLKQVWANLLSNALKYTRRREVAMIEVGCAVRDGTAAFFVRDNGAGFDMRYAEKLFGVFQRLHRAEDYEGTGVGLAIVQRIVHRHGGRVWAEAEPERGATFFFTLNPEPHRP